MTQAVLDGATRPVYYESRVIKLKLDDKVLTQIDAEYSALAKNADEDVIQDLLKLAKEMLHAREEGISPCKNAHDCKEASKKYKYLPEGQEDALKTVVSQCELWTDNIADFEDAELLASYFINDNYRNLKVVEQTSRYGETSKENQ